MSGDPIEDDLARAKAILAKGKAVHEDAVLYAKHDPNALALQGRAIYGADSYAAYQLLERFVAEIERLRIEDERAAALFPVADALLSDQDRGAGAAGVIAALIAEIERLRADAERERLARRRVDEALLALLQEHEALKARLVDGYGS